MKTVHFRSGSSSGIFPVLISLIVVVSTVARADQVEMRNGDRYSGKVVGLSSNQVVLKSEFLGTLRIRRDNVAGIRLGEQPVPAAPASAPASTGTNAPIPKAPPVPVISSADDSSPQIDMNSPVSQLIAANPHLVNEVRSQVLAGAGTNAVAKYDSLVGGLASGNLDLADISREAASVATQLRQLRGSEDAESAEIFDEYLSILDSFVAATKLGASQTNPLVQPQPTNTDQDAQRSSNGPATSQP